MLHFLRDSVFFSRIPRGDVCELCFGPAPCRCALVCLWLASVRHNFRVPAMLPASAAAHFLKGSCHAAPQAVPAKVPGKWPAKVPAKWPAKVPAKAPANFRP